MESALSGWLPYLELERRVLDEAVVVHVETKVLVPHRVERLAADLCPLLVLLSKVDLLVSYFYFLVIYKGHGSSTVGQRTSTKASVSCEIVSMIGSPRASLTRTLTMHGMIIEMPCP